MADRGRGGKTQQAGLGAKERRSLIAHALKARDHAYAPYSNYHVGAALLTRDGEIIPGCNVENASYPLTVCAERTALGTLVAGGRKPVVAMAVATESVPPASPCGACRQVLFELAPDAVLLLCNPAGDVVETTVVAMLPGAFTPSTLLKRHPAPAKAPKRAVARVHP